MRWGTSWRCEDGCFVIRVQLFSLTFRVLPGTTIATRATGTRYTLELHNNSHSFDPCAQHVPCLLPPTSQANKTRLVPTRTFTHFSHTFPCSTFQLFILHLSAFQTIVTRCWVVVSAVVMQECRTSKLPPPQSSFHSTHTRPKMT